MPPIRGTPLEIGGGVAMYLLVGYFFLGGGWGEELPRTCRNFLPQFLIVYPKIDKLKSNAMTLIYYFYLFVADTLICFYQNDECLWNYNIPEYHKQQQRPTLRLPC